MIALCMIIKDTEPFEILARCLYSVAPYVDGLFLTLNGPSKTITKEAKDLKVRLEKLCVQRKYPALHIDYIQWEKDFSKARNHNFSQAPKKFDYILWIDADDIFRGGPKLKEVEARAKRDN